MDSSTALRKGGFMTIQRNIDSLRGIARSGPCRLATAVALVLLLACSHKGVNHKPVKDFVYVFAIGSWVVYVLDAESLTVQDSITGFVHGGNPVEDMVVTPDGRWLFTTGEQGSTGENRVRKINTATKEIVATVNTAHPGRLVLLDHGRLLYWGGCDGFLTDVDQFPIVTRDTTEVCVQNGPRAGTTVAGGVAGTNHIRIETVRPRTTVAEFVATKIDSVPVSVVYYVALHPDGKRVSAIVRGGGYFFIVADIATGETVYQHAFTSQAGQFSPGEIAINSAGTVAVVTDPGKGWFGEYVGTIDVVDLVNLRLLKRFDWSDFGYPQSNGQIAFTSDERAVIVTAMAVAAGIPDVHRVDLTSLTIARTAVMPDTECPGAMTVAPAPN
jgi:hypothetical protein